MPIDYRILGSRGGGGSSPSFDVFPFTPGDFVATATGTPPTLGNNGGVQVWSFADGATGEIVTQFAVPASWRQVSLSFSWVNPNAGAGNVRWRVAMRNLAVAIDGTGAAMDSDVSANVAAAAQNVINLRANHVTGFDTSPATFGSVFSLLLSRIGADAGDTLVGAAELGVPVLSRTG